MKKKINFEKGEKELLNQVPINYYQLGVKKNFLQKTWHTGKLNAVYSLISEIPGSILDVGCASGWFLNELHRKYPAASCSGVDKYRSAIVFGNKKYKKIKLIYADAHDLPFKAGTFDLIICTEVLEHVKNPGRVLLEIKRVLKKDGRVVVEMDSGNFLFRAAWYWWTNLRKGVWKDAHIHVFNTKKLEKTILKSGFKIKKKKVFNITMGVAFLLEKK